MVDQEISLLEDRANRNICFYSAGGISLQIEADLPIAEDTFISNIQRFRVGEVENDRVILHHYFYLPDLPVKELGKAVYRNAPWAIYRRDNQWIYLGISPIENDDTLHRVVVFNDDHSVGEIYSSDEKIFQSGSLESLTLFPTDQILLARLLADRQGCILHSSGMIIDGQGVLFVGHSGAGKSTIVTQLRRSGEILCDDRNIIRRYPEGFRLYGTWSHGDVTDVSPASAPLRAVFLLEQAPTNALIPLQDRREALHQLLPMVIRPLVTTDWWEKTLDVLEQLVREVPVYRLQFDRSGRVIDVLKSLL